MGGLVGRVSRRAWRQRLEFASVTRPRGLGLEGVEWKGARGVLGKEGFSGGGG